MLVKLLTNKYVVRALACLEAFGAFAKDECGASIVAIALSMPVLIGAMGLAAEISYWRLHHRAMQNAADSAAIAAATNNGPTYVAEAQSVAAQYGFANGSGQITVTVANPDTAAACTANCYKVTVSDNVPLFLSQIVGYGGSASSSTSSSGSQNGGFSSSSQRSTIITANAVATTIKPYTYCVLALATSGKQGLTSHGAPNADLNGCNTMSNTGADCTGHNLNANVGDAAGTNSGCGITQNSGVAPIADPFSNLASSIPPDTCNNKYPQEPTKTKSPALPLSNQLFGTYGFGTTKVLCGDQQLIGNTTINNTVLVIENGQLDTNGYTLQGTGLTVIFSGSNNPNYEHIPTGGGTLDITAPTDGTWSGVAIYQDPSLTKNVDISAAGNSPTWDISGLVYLPHSSVTLSGAVNKSSQGLRCFELVMDNLTINGTGDIFANNDQCDGAGLNQTRGGNRGMLVN
jgi:Flp pilus assembly protein TadG